MACWESMFWSQLLGKSAYRLRAQLETLKVIPPLGQLRPGQLAPCKAHRGGEGGTWTRASGRGFGARSAWLQALCCGAHPVQGNPGTKAPLRIFTLCPRSSPSRVLMFERPFFLSPILPLPWSPVPPTGPPTGTTARPACSRCRRTCSLTSSTRCCVTS